MQKLHLLALLHYYRSKHSFHLIKCSDLEYVTINFFFFSASVAIHRKKSVIMSPSNFRTLTRTSFVLLMVLQLATISKLSAQREVDASVSGKQTFLFDNGGKLSRPIKVYYYSPTANPKDLPIVILMHGAHRNAKANFAEALDAAAAFNCVLIAPEFTKEAYPEGDMYTFGNVYNRKGKQFNPKEAWTFELIEPLFDEVVKQIKSTSSGYYIYGHSAGGQFVSRFLMYETTNRIIKAAAANPGWYTMPTNDVDFPYGLSKSSLPTSNLNAMYAKKMFLLLGTADTLREEEDFYKTAQADAEGMTRFARGQNFFQQSKTKAIELKTPFNWTEVFVPDAGHSNTRMCRFAFSLFFMDIK